MLLLAYAAAMRCRGAEGWLVHDGGCRPAGRGFCAAVALRGVRWWYAACCTCVRAGAVLAVLA